MYKVCDSCISFVTLTHIKNYRVITSPTNTDPRFMFTAVTATNSFLMGDLLPADTPTYDLYLYI